MAKRSTFGSRFGTIVVVGGSVVGLGNVWRFPYVAGENGGAAFILVYIAVSLMISVPIMLSEFVVGRSAKRNSMRCFKKLSRIKAWQGVGYLGIITAFTILSFYSVIAGWAIEYIRQSVSGEYMSYGPQEVKNSFDGFIASGWRPLLMMVIFILMTATIVSAGIEKGIEKFNKAAMPAMVLILIILCINSFTLSGFSAGASFILKPDFSGFSLSTVLNAMGQSFFSMSLGMGIMVTYGSYIKKKDNMFRIAGTVAVSDVTIAVLSGLAIFPAVFTFGINPSSGPNLVFLTLPNIFSQMAAGQILGLLFFILLFAAAITSSVSLMEVVVAYVSEEFRLKRKFATFAVAMVLAGVSTLCILSQMSGSIIVIGGMNLFDFFDHITSVYMLPLGGFLIVIFVGWFMKGQLVRNEMTTGGVYSNRLYSLLRPLVKYVIPVLIAVLFLNLIGLIG